MNVFLQLIKITGASVEPTIEEKKRSKAFGAVMGVIIGLFIFLPVAFFVGFMVYALTSGLSALGGESNSAAAGLKLMLHIVTLFSVVFGFNVVMSVFYFSKDLDYLLPLPISPMKIVGAKLASTMISENVMECILVISALVGFMVGYGVTPAGIFAAVIAIFTFPVLPICYCAIVCMIVMYFSKFFKNKERVSKITAFSSVVILIALVFALNLSNGFSPDVFVEQLMHNDIKLLSVLDIIFVNVPLMSNAMAGSFISLLLYIIVNAVAVGIVMLLASQLYLKTVVSINGGDGASKYKEANFDKAIKESSHIETYFKKEIKILFRTPAYMTNCVGINLIWPIFIYLFIVLQNRSDFLSGFIYKLQEGQSEAILYVTVLVFGVSVILTSLNCLASSAITREGRHFEIMKYMPVDIMTQINSKALVSIVISGSGLIVYIITTFVILKISAYFCMFCVFLSILSVIYSTYLGIYIDTINPKLIWDDEVNALRGNYHVFYNMAIEILLTAIVCVVALGLNKLDFLPVFFIQNLILIASGVMAFEFYLLCKNKGVKNIEKIEM